MTEVHPSTRSPSALSRPGTRAADRQFNCARAGLTVGRDGMVYLTSAGQDTGYILRVSRDGRDKLGSASVPAIHNATADAGGLIAGTHGHFSHQVALYSREFQKLQAVTDFLVSDQVGWDAPASVEVGAGGNFYGLDHHRDRILQIDAHGKVVQAHSLPHFDNCPPQGFRVCERAQAFYVFFWGKPELHCLGFDGTLKWQQSLGISTNTYEGDGGGHGFQSCRLRAWGKNPLGHPPARRRPPGHKTDHPLRRQLPNARGCRNRVRPGGH
jgi:hypothetical protein